VLRGEMTARSEGSVRVRCPSIIHGAPADRLSVVHPVQPVQCATKRPAHLLEFGHALPNLLQARAAPSPPGSRRGGARQPVPFG
jgi:hypothetical protein